MGVCFSMLWRSTSNENREGCRDETVVSSSTVTLSEDKFSASMISTATSEGKFSASTMSSGWQSSVSECESAEDKLFPQGRILELPNLRMFTFAELQIATRYFRPEMFLGQGGFGTVYKGWVQKTAMLPAKPGQGMQVAVKRLNPNSMQGWKEWLSEVNFLGRLSHPNLVKLLGYCTEKGDLLLVYEYMAKGSLENHLFRRSANPLSWDFRLKIAIDAARGLAFLHSADNKIIYRDFKSSNILLDSNYNGKISDFGLAKVGPPPGESHLSTTVVGTLGYAAPEYMNTGHLYIKSDVYGFGVVLLELLCGQKAVDFTRSYGKINLVEWVRPFLLDRWQLIKVMDPQIKDQCSSMAVSLVGHLTLTCLADDPKDRPPMKTVLEKLEVIQATKDTREELAPPKPGARNRHNAALRPHQRRLVSRHQAPRSEERRVYHQPSQTINQGLSV